MINSIRKFSLVSLALFGASLALAAGDPSGTWKFKAEAGERSTESTLTLKWSDNRLTGTMDNRMGKVDITEAKFVDDQLTFTVERTIGKRLRKKKFTLHYAGKLDGDTIKGTIQTKGRDEKPVSMVWDAQRVK